MVVVVGLKGKENVGGEKEKGKESGEREKESGEKEG